MSNESSKADEASGVYREELLSEAQLARHFELEDEPYLAWSSVVPDELLLREPLPAHGAEYC